MKPDMHHQRALKHLSASDPIMADLIGRIGPIDGTPRRLPPFQSLVQSIIHQQLSGKAAGTILGRFQKLFERDFPTPEEVLKADPLRLRSAGLSRAKTNYIRDVAQKALDAAVPTLEECDGLHDAELITRLTSIKGVGRWTVEMLLIFNLGRPDVLPIHDLGVRRGFQLAYRKRQLPAPLQLERFGSKWKPHRTIAAKYLWRAVDLLK